MIGTRNGPRTRSERKSATIGFPKSPCKHGSPHADGVRQQQQVIETSYSFTGQQQLTIWEKVRPELRSAAPTRSRSTSRAGHAGETPARIRPRFSITKRRSRSAPGQDRNVLELGVGLPLERCTRRYDLGRSGNGAPVDRSESAVRSKGYELGLRTQAIPDLTSTMTVWNLDLASELLFVGDAGTTEPSRPSRRNGVGGRTFTPSTAGFVGMPTFAFTHARFQGDDPAGNNIPGAVGTVVNTGTDGSLAHRILLYVPLALLRSATTHGRQQRAVEIYEPL